MDWRRRGYEDYIMDSRPPMATAYPTWLGCVVILTLVGVGFTLGWIVNSLLN